MRTSTSSKLVSQVKTLNVRNSDVRVFLTNKNTFKSCHQIQNSETLNRIFNIFLEVLQVPACLLIKDAVKLDNLIWNWTVLFRFLVKIPHVHDRIKIANLEILR